MKRASDWLAAWQRVINAASLFPPGHPAIEQCARDCSNAGGELIAGGPVTIGVLTNGFTLQSSTGDGTSTPVESTDAHRELAERLSMLLIAGVQLSRAWPADSIIRVCEELVRCTRDPLKPALLAERVSTLSEGAIQAHVVSAERLKFGEGAREDAAGKHADGSHKAVNWSDLLSILNAPSPSTGSDVMAGHRSAEFEALAIKLSEQIRASDPSSIAALRSSLLSMLAPRTGEPLAEQMARAQRARALVSALPANLQAALASADADRSASDSLRFLVEFADRLPTSDVLAVLESIGRHDQRISSEPVKLFRTLMGTRVRTRGEAEALSKSLGSFTPADPLAGEELRAALADILRDTKAEEYTPDYYQATIDAAARDLQAGTTGALLHSESADHARQHAASIACLVLKNFADPEWCPPGVVRSMVGSLAWLIDQGEATQVARCERAISQQSRSGRAGSEIATEWSTALSRADVGEALLRAADRGDDPESIARLMGASGTSSLRSLLEAEQTAAHDQLVASLMGSASTDELATLFDEWAAAKPRSALKLIRGAMSLPFERGEALFKKALGVPDDALRREGMLGCTRGGTSWSEPLATHALGDADPGIQRLAIEGVGRIREPWAFTLLAGYLSGRVGPEKPTRENYEKASTILVSIGPDQRLLAAAVLQFLCWRIGSPRARLADVLAAALKGWVQEPEVRRALARWRRAPARWVVKLQGPDAQSGKAAA